MRYAGQLAALATSLCWTTNAVFFTLAGRRIGSPTVNVTRLLMAFFAMLAAGVVFFGAPLPTHASAATWGWLSVSGLIGFALGDAVMFEAFVRLGPRLTTLIATVWPILSALMAWPIFGDTLDLKKFGAIALTLAGIAWVVTGRSATTNQDGEPHPHLASGIGLALVGALCQALGVILSKLGMKEGLHPVQANSIRVVAGIVALMAWYGFKGELPDMARRLKDVRSTVYITLGAVTGPVLGVIFSLYAIRNTHTGIASTLMALAPVFLLPVSALVFKERVTLRTLLGTGVTFAGVVALFLA